MILKNIFCNFEKKDSVVLKNLANFSIFCHLDKITNVDEFVKRVSTVLHSNDPVARALTLR